MTTNRLNTVLASFSPDLPVNNANSIFSFYCFFLFCSLLFSSVKINECLVFKMLQHEKTTLQYYANKEMFIAEILSILNANVLSNLWSSNGIYSKEIHQSNPLIKPEYSISGTGGGDSLLGMLTQGHPACRVHREVRPELTGFTAIPSFVPL